MGTDKGKYPRWVHGLRFFALLLGGATVTGLAWAGSFQFGEELSGEYKVTFGYAAAMRMEDPSERLIGGPVDPLQTTAPNPPDNPFPGFGHSGLPTTTNFDDGNRNFEKHSLINNRATAFTEFGAKYRNFGFSFTGSAHYDRVYHESNDNNSPRTINKSEGRHDEFSDRALAYNGERGRVLDAYLYGDWQLFDDRVFLNLRVGQHLSAWGESLFMPGIASAQGPNDATKAFVPGAEIKEILLPMEQVSMRMSIGPRLTVLGQYKLEYDITEVFPVGDFFSPADVVGPGAEFIYGSINPAFGEGCPGLFPPPLDAICMVPLGGQLLNAPRTINVVRGPDLKPDDDGQWGLGVTYQVLPDLNLGLYHIRYHSFNPTLKLNTGFAFIGDLAGVPITTGVIQQFVPISYNIEYFDDIKMTAGSFSTVLFGLNFAGELIYRQDVDTQVQAIVSGVRTPIFTRSEMYEAQASTLYVANPKFLWYDEIIFVGEVKYLHVADVDPIRPSNGIDPVGNGDELFGDETAYGYQFLMFLTSRNLVPGWDLKNTISGGDVIKGNPSLAGSFGALFGEGDQRFGFGISMQYLQNLEFAVAYNWLRGDPGARISGEQGDSYVQQNPYADRDYMTLTVKYNL